MDVLMQLTEEPQNNITHVTTHAQTHNRKCRVATLHKYSPGLTQELCYGRSGATPNWVHTRPTIFVHTRKQLPNEYTYDPLYLYTQGSNSELSTHTTHYICTHKEATPKWVHIRPTIFAHTRKQLPNEHTFDPLYLYTQGSNSQMSTHTTHYICTHKEATPKWVHIRPTIYVHTRKQLPNEHTYDPLYLYTQGRNSQMSTHTTHYICTHKEATPKWAHIRPTIFVHTRKQLPNE
jgi:hypothetical protein